MALVQYGPIVSAVSGSIGGVTFSKSSAGAIARVRRGPLQTISNPRGIVKNRFAFIAKRFSSLDVGAQSLWRSFAAANPVPTRFGGTQILSPIAMYTYINGALMAQSAVVIDTPPGSLNVSGMTEFVIIAVPDPGGSITIRTRASAIVADEYLQLYISSATGSSRTTSNVGYYQIPLVNQVADSTFDITAAWVARFGSLPQGPGQALLGKVRIVNSVTGGRSPYLTQITNFGAAPPINAETMIFSSFFNSTIANGDFYALDGGPGAVSAADMDPGGKAVSVTNQPMVFSNLSVAVNTPDILNDITITLMSGGTFTPGTIPTPVSTGISVTLLAGSAEGSDSINTYDANGFEYLSFAVTSGGAVTASEVFFSIAAVPGP